MEKTNEIQTYELSYHLTSDIEEGDVVSEKEKIESIITQLGGNIVASFDPKRKHLSYPINHKHHAFFGYLDFSIQKDLLKSIEDQLKLIDSVIRYIFVVKHEKGPSITTLFSKDMKSKYTKKSSADRQKEEIKVRPEIDKKLDSAIDQELEGVLKKL